MRKSFTIDAPWAVTDATRKAIEHLKTSDDKALRDCASAFEAILASKITISSGSIDVMGWTQDRQEPIARAAHALADVWFDVAIGNRFDQPSAEQRVRPVLDLLAAAART